MAASRGAGWKAVLPSPSRIGRGVGRPGPPDGRTIWSRTSRPSVPPTKEPSLTTDDLDVIVCGAGLAGLGCGALLAEEGLRVRVLERRPVVGGRALTVEQDGFTLNYGLHYVMDGWDSPHVRLVRTIDREDEVPFVPVQTDKLWRLREGELHPVPAGLLDLLGSDLVTTPGKIGLPRAFIGVFLSRSGQLDEVAAGPWLEEVARDPTLRRFFLDLAGPLSFVADPADLSAGHLVRLLRSLLSPGVPAVYPVGGWGTLLEACRRHVEEQEGEVRDGTEVTELVVEGDRVRGVVADGEEMRAPTVVSALPPAALADLLDDRQLPGLDPARLRSLEPTAGIAVDLGVEGIENGTHGAIEMPEHHATSGCHTVWDPTLAPEGCHLFQALRFLPPDEANREAADRTADLFLDVLETIWPSIRDRVVTRRTLIRPVLTSAAHVPGQSRSELPPVDAAAEAGLWVVGDWVSAPGELSNPALEGAFEVAEALAARLLHPPARAGD